MALAALLAFAASMPVAAEDWSTLHREANQAIRAVGLAYDLKADARGIRKPGPPVESAIYRLDLR